MKSEPDRLDFLIVVLPILLLGLLGFQAYEYIQMDRQRAGALPVSLEEPPAAADGQEPESAEAAPAEGESGDAAMALPIPDAQPGGAPAGDTAAQNADTVMEEQGATDSPEGDLAPGAGEPAVKDQMPVAGEPAAGADPALPEAVAADQPAEEAAQADQPAVEVLLPTRTGTEAPVPGPPAFLEEAVVAADPQVLLQLRTNPVKVGELFEVDIVIREASGVSGAVFHLRYDKTLLQINEDPQSELGPFLEDPEGGTRFNTVPLATGRVVVSINLPLGVEGRSGDGRLMTLYFQALAPGETGLDMLQSALRNRLNRPVKAVFSGATLIIVE